jgi:acetyl-CoA carboxylase alpha subunit
MATKSKELLDLIKTIASNKQTIERIKNENLLLSDKISELKDAERSVKIDSVQAKLDERIAKMQEKMQKLNARKLARKPGAVTIFDGEGNICNEISENLKAQRLQGKFDI